MRLSPQDESSGARHFPAALSQDAIGRLQKLANRIVGDKPGIRILDDLDVGAIAGSGGAMGSIATGLLGANAKPVRAVLFDKSARNNWAVPWHQDRTIAVRDRQEVPGFGPWSRKNGTWHVEPPFEITARMITLRGHLDDCDEYNAPLLYVSGSHKIGKLPAAALADFARRRGHVMSLAKVGDVWAYGTAIVHSSEAATEPRRRRVLQVDYSVDKLPAELEWAGI